MGQFGINSIHLDKIIKDNNSYSNMQIVFVDIVKYSKRKTQRQVQLINEFTQILKRSILETNKKHLSIFSNNNINFEKDIVVIPTGDGAAIGLPFDFINQLHLDLGVQLLKEISEVNKQNNCSKFNEQDWCNCHNSLSLRIGISVGTVILYKDINSNFNIAGNPINIASRVMNFADVNQIIFTSEAYEKFVDFDSDSEIEKAFRKYADIEMKHNIKITAYQYINNQFDFLNNNIIKEFNNNINEEIVSASEIESPQSEQNPLDLIFIESGKVNSMFHNTILEIPYNFLISRKLISQRQYNEIMGINRSQFQNPDNPIESVSWHDAIEFCNKLSLLHNLGQVYSIKSTEDVEVNYGIIGYRLPSELEWEFALGYSKEEIFSQLNSIAWYSSNSNNQPHQSGLKRMDKNGVFDMLGNLWEWCNDPFSKIPCFDVLTNLHIVDSINCVVRGGSFADFKSTFDQGNRKKENKKIRKNTNGFRIVLQIK